MIHTQAFIWKKEVGFISDFARQLQMLELRYNDTHQALMVVRRMEWVAAVLDGKRDPEIEKAAEKTCRKLVQLCKETEPELLGKYSGWVGCVGWKINKVKFALFYAITFGFFQDLLKLPYQAENLPLNVPSDDPTGRWVVMRTSSHHLCPDFAPTRDWFNYRRRLGETYGCFPFREHGNLWQDFGSSLSTVPASFCEIPTNSNEVRTQKTGNQNGFVARIFQSCQYEDQ